MSGPGRAAVEERALAAETARAGAAPAERVLAYLRGYGVAPRRVRKHRREIGILARALDAAAPRSVLDCPCGWGRLAAPCAAGERTVVLADRSAERLALLATLGLAEGRPRLRADALALPFRDRSFDFVLSAHLNYHFERRADRLRHLRECLRVARGAALVSYHGALSPRRALRALASLLSSRPRMRTLRAADLRACAAAEGFALAGIYPLSRFSGHAYAFLRRAST